MGNYNTKTETNRAHNTAGHNDLTQGKNASHMMQEDLGKIRRYRDVIKNVAEESGIDPAVIAAIVSRDQIQMNDNPEKTLRDITYKLAKCIADICSKNPTWTKEQQFKGGIAAYKVGVRKVHSYEDRDEYDPDGNYSDEVVDRIQWFKKNMHF